MPFTFSLPVWFVGDRKMNPIGMLSSDGPDFIPLFATKELADKFLSKAQDPALMFWAIRTVPLLLNFIDAMMNGRNQHYCGLDPDEGRCENVVKFAELRETITRTITESRP